MKTYDETFEERQRFEAELAKRGIEVWGAGVDMTTLEWDISIDFLNIVTKGTETLTLYGAKETQAFLDSWDAGQEIREVAN